MVQAYEGVELAFIPDSRLQGVKRGHLLGVTIPKEEKYTFRHNLTGYPHVKDGNHREKR